MNFELLASCQCGAVQFRSTASPLLQVSCHCTDCRDATGDAYSNIAFFSTKSARIVGAVKSKSYLSESQNKTERILCVSCNDVMFDKSEGFPNIIGVFIKQIQVPFVTNINCHVWINSKLSQTSLAKHVVVYDKGIPQ